MKKITKQRGTQDVLPADSWKWQRVEAVMHEVAQLYGYGEIRLPTFEATELFTRGVGDTTDIVTKEMYTFDDKGGRSITLRPEGTAGVARATLENGLLASQPLPLKMYYIMSCFRYEKAQKGRLREFHQFGIECYATHDAASDVEVMEVTDTLLTRLGVRDVVGLEINSIGCPECRPAYHAKLKEYFEAYRADLCPTCLERLDKNPMRILDCKEEKCAAIAQNAPIGLDSLCPECAEHFDAVKTGLDDAGIAYTVNPRIVRGLDYYTNTVFEFVASGVGTQGTVCGGGRYDGLIAEMGGQPTPGIGFAMGIERLLLLLEEQGKLGEAPGGPEIYLVGMEGAGRTAARRITRQLRAGGVRAECDIAGRSVKAQMKAAGRAGARFTVVIGEDEVASGTARIKRMQDGTEFGFALDNAEQALQDAKAAPADAGQAKE